MPGYFFAPMDIQENIINKVAQSGLVTLDPASFYPEGERVVYDIKDNLFMELILREKDFREFVKGHDWSPLDRSIDALVSRLRKKIEADATKPMHIKSVRGIGYMFATDVRRG